MATGTVVRPCKEAQCHRILQGIRCTHFTPLQCTAPSTTHTSDTYGLPKPVTIGPQTETAPAKGLHPKPQLTT